MEYVKFEKRRAPYRKALAEFRKMGFTTDDYIHHNPSFAGHMNLARFLALYETYKQTLGLSGHIAEVGVWKASCLLYFAKLTQLFEPESLTLVHGFDWFRGLWPGTDEMTDHVRKLWKESTRSEDENRPRTGKEAVEMYRKISKLISIQNLDHIVHLHKLDVTKELGSFFDEHPHIQFKIVFLDAGTYEVVAACLPHFWPRLVSGGVLILDQFNNEIAPGETRALREYLPDIPIHSYVFTGHPSAYIVKPSSTVPEPIE
jgi:hypothetical protein